MSKFDMFDSLSCRLNRCETRTHQAFLRFFVTALFIASGVRIGFSQTPGSNPSFPGSNATNQPNIEEVRANSSAETPPLFAPSETIEDPVVTPPQVLVEPFRRESFADVIGQSLFGPLRPERWRPLGLAGFLSEGWDEAYAPVPSTEGTSRIAPRQTWINNADGAFYRLFVFSFGFARGLPGNADLYNGSYFMFTPLSRRFEIGWFFPFVVSDPRSPGKSPTNYDTGVGDLTIAPRFLLAEDKRYSVTSNLFVRVPTGNGLNGNGVASLSPDVEFWANPFGGWVFRGGAGVTTPTNLSPAKIALLSGNPWTGFNASPSTFSSFDARFAVGKYITAPDAKFLPNLVVDVAANLHTAISGGNATYFSLTPGFRFGIGNEWYLLGGVEVPLVGPLPFQTQTIFQIIKNF